MLRRKDARLRRNIALVVGNGTMADNQASDVQVELEADLALIAVVGRGMKSTRGTAGRIFSALAHANINVKMIDQGSSELNIIIGVSNDDFEEAIKAIYDIFVETRL